MKRLACACTGVWLAMLAGVASALPGNFVIDQFFSNADGSIQFLEVFDGGSIDCDAGEQLWKGQELRSTGPAGTKVHTFTANLPTCKTTQRHILIASEGFAALGVVTPDFVIPNGFLPLTAATIVMPPWIEVGYAALPTDGITALDRFGKPMTNRATNLAGATASIVAPPVSTVVEFYNAKLDHYFISWIAAEIAILDEGVKIKGWTRTGAAFRTYTAAQATTSPVCRFYIPPALGDSHFFGRGTAECDSTAAKFPDLVLEDPAFMHMVPSSAGTCPPGTVNVYRVFSNRPDANHRYMTDPAVRDAMKARGWTAEGDGPDLVVMCAPA